MFIADLNRLTLVIHFKRGFFTDKFKQSEFTFYSNGILTRLTSENREKSIDLKCVVKQIKIEAAFIYIQKINNVKRNKLLNISTAENIIALKNNNSNSIDAKIKSFDDSITINVDDVIEGEEKIYLKDAMFMFIPIKSGSKKKWIILFPEFEKLNNWLKNIEKWVTKK